MFELLTPLIFVQFHYVPTLDPHPGIAIRIDVGGPRHHQFHTSTAFQGFGQDCCSSFIDVRSCDPVKLKAAVEAKHLRSDVELTLKGMGQEPCWPLPTVRSICDKLQSAVSAVSHVFWPLASFEGVIAWDSYGVSGTFQVSRCVQSCSNNPWPINRLYSFTNTNRIEPKWNNMQ